MEPLVTIAIPDLAEPGARSATLNSLVRHTPEPHEVVLLVEEARGQNAASWPGNQALRQIVVPASFAAPAALNRLLATCTTPYILLLESGAIVTSGWLGRLLEAFDDPAVGLSGPSTNISWNEQQIAPANRGQGWSVQQIDTYAASVSARYSNQRHPLSTLHSLGDFCYLFKRSLAEQLGGFDEAYGAGPCWEIDFNTRAARAGFQAVWVADAYVHRAPSTPRQVQTLRRLFTTSKQLYQDRFCGLRLRGEKTNYEPHCRGEACEHFAPPDLIQVTLHQDLKSQPAEEPSANKKTIDNAPGTLSAVATQSLGETSSLSGVSSNTPPKTAGERIHTTTGSQPAITSISGPPLVSCIMPTRNRRAFMRQALAYFERQDYPNRELIIVDDGDDRISDLIPSDAQMRYIAVSQKTSIGAKRNIACEQARGAIIAHWDDDDWYAPHRLQYQVVPLLDKKADMTGLETPCFFDLTRWQAWTCTPELHRRLFVGDVHGGTLVYWRKVWEHLAHYPSASLAEDALFLRDALRRGARLQKLPPANSFVYLRHANNAWCFPLGSYLHPAGWQHAEPGAFLPPEDLSFYETLSPAVADPVRGKGDPLVSCIMPTYNRRAFVSQAIEYFLRQDYPNKELIVVDDGTDAIGALVPADEHIRYVRMSEKTPLGAKRNLACEQARGEIIAHWDDDDWHAPHRLSYQVEALRNEGTEMCGIKTLLFYDREAGRAWCYAYPENQRAWLSGSTLCYKRAFWLSHRFAPINVGEDSRFVWNACKEHMTVLPDSTFHVGIIHRQNVSPKQTRGAYWHSYPLEEIRRLLGADWAYYQAHQPSAIGKTSLSGLQLGSERRKRL